MSIAICRSVILYLCLIIGIRLMGKRQVGELEPSELVLALIMADLVAVPMQDFGLPLLYGLLPVITLLCVTMILSVLTTRSIRFRALLCGRPSVIIHEGKLRQEEMRKNRVTIDELHEELRMNGIVDISKIKYAILETNGRLSTILYSAHQPATAEQLGVAAPEEEVPYVVINDGRVLTRNLQAAGLDERWLASELKARGVARAGQVFLLSVDRQKNVYFSAKDGAPS